MDNLDNKDNGNTNDNWDNKDNEENRNNIFQHIKVILTAVNFGAKNFRLLMRTVFHSFLKNFLIHEL